MLTVEDQKFILSFNKSGAIYRRTTKPFISNHLSNFNKLEDVFL